MDFAEVVSIGKDIAIGFAALLGAISGTIALNQWRKEMKGTDKYKIAKQIGMQVVVVSLSLHAARSAWTEEMQKKYEELEDDELQWKMSADFIKQAARLYLVEDQYDRLIVLLAEAEVLRMGIEGKGEPYRNILNELWFAATLIDGYSSGQMKERKRTEIAIREAMTKLSGRQDDETGKKIEEAKTTILSSIRRYL